MNRKGFTQSEVAEIIKRYQSGESRLSLATSFKSKSGTIGRILTQNNIEIRPHEFRKKLSPLTEKEIMALYSQGNSSRSLAKKYGVDAVTIRNIIVRIGGELRPVGNKVREYSEEDIKLIAEMAEQGKSQREIGEYFHTDQLAISRLMERNGVVPYFTMAQRGEKNRNWKGGIHIKNGEYRMVRVWKDSPFTSMRNISGYVLEHRLIMAQALGRPLLNSESVHHINGNGLDNRIENLQLRFGNHGKGVVLECLDCGSHNIRATKIAED